MRRLIYILMTALLAGCIANAHAEVSSFAPANTDEKKGSAGLQFGAPFAQDGSGSYSMLDSSSVPLAFSEGTQVVVSCSSQQMVCVTMARPSRLTMTLSTMSVTDSLGANGRSSCARVEAGTYRSFVVDLSIFGDSSAVGRRTRTCTGSYAGWPCAISSDCPGASTCDASTTIADITKAFVAASSTDCAGSVE